MKLEDYAQGDAFQAEKRSIFSTEWLPVCAAGQIANPGAYLAATVGGWSVVAVRDRNGAVRVLRNVCRHQNMPVVGQPTGQCETFRCRFHGWTYDLAGRFLGAPAQVAPSDPSADNNLASLTVRTEADIVFFTLGKLASAPNRGGQMPAYGGTIVTDIACNWKVVVEHLLIEQAGSARDFIWQAPLLAIRRAGTTAIVEQVVPHTFLRTRLFTHVFGDSIGGHRQAAETIKRACEQLQADRVSGSMASSDTGERLSAFHEALRAAYGSS